MIIDGQFREDLFHRLDLLRISIPPLSQRGKDLPELADHFLKALSQKYRLPKPQMDESFNKYLRKHSWPGNIRELLHELERSLVLCEPGNNLSLSNQSTTNLTNLGENDPTDWLNRNFIFPEKGFDLEQEILRFIQLGIKQADGNVTAAARLLGVPRDYLRYRLKK
jgi:DNA-binding NtrC family response regulator